MHLKGLAGGGPQGAVAQSVGQVIQSQEQLSRNPTTGIAEPQHHLPAAHLVGFAQFPVVLLIAAVEFEQLNGVFREADVVVGKFRQQRLAQMAAVELALFRFGEGLVDVVRRCQSLGSPRKSMNSKLAKRLPIQSPAVVLTP